MSTAQREYSIGKFKVKISAPVLVARRKDYLWFPTLIRLPDGAIMAVMSSIHDVITTRGHQGHPGLNALSFDEGRSWGELFPSVYYEIPVSLESGDLLLL